MLSGYVEFPQQLKLSLFVRYELNDEYWFRHFLVTFLHLSFDMHTHCNYINSSSRNLPYLVFITEESY